MKLRELKKVLESLNDNQLDNNLIVIANEKCSSGLGEAYLLKTNLYYNEEDDPSPLMTKSEMLNMGIDIEDCDPYLRKGELIIELE